MMTYKIFVGQIVHCPSVLKVDVLDNGYIIINGQGTIVDVGCISALEAAKQNFKIKDYELYQLEKSQILIPGLIDTHIHAPQYPNIGLGYDKPLLQWLDNYTYKLEEKYKDLNLCWKVFDVLVKKTLSYGTTTACYFGSLYRTSTMILVDILNKCGQRSLVGKINMTRLAPTSYLETPEESINETLKFIDNVQSINNKLIEPVITPRFALSVDMDLMKKLGDIAKDKNLHIQTHIAENHDELELVSKLYPNSKSYTQLYYDCGLLTSKTVLAHGIFLSDDEKILLKLNNTSISHCPESNTNLSSGLCDVRNLLEQGINVGLGTDVAGGASPSIITAMKSAITVSTHLSFIKTNYKPLDYLEVFYLATLGGAKALAMEDKIGNFSINKQFDALIIDLNVNSCDYIFECTPLELLQKFIYVGDDRNIVTVFVDGKIVKQINK